MSAIANQPGSAPSPESRQGLYATESGRVFQAGRDQYIFDRPPLAPAAASNTLPRDTAAFTGRDAELRGIVDQVRFCLGGGGPIPVYVIDGMPGVGKSALAIHVGHELEQYFPDGQYFIDLYGHAPAQEPARPIEALFALLTAAGVAAAEIPADLDARAALWRSRMAGRKALVIVDNAASRWQVEHLLPGAPGCLVLVTSRRRLTGLTASHAAHTIALDMMPPDQATELFARMSGRSALGSDADAIAEIVSLCGGLPLAICLLAARLRPEQWPVEEFVTALSRTRHLAQMCADDVTVAAAFDVSYRKLPPERQRFFRQLGLHPGADVDAYLGAALADIPPTEAQRHLDELYHDRLLDQPVLRRYRMHDLIREYTKWHADQQPDADRTDALNRLVRYFGTCVRLADLLLARRGGERMRAAGPSAAPLTVSAADPLLPDLSTRQRALAWMEAEQANLFACAAMLTANADHRQLVTLAAAMASYLRQAGPWEGAAVLYERAAAAATQLGDAAARAHALRELGAVRWLCGDYAVADEVLRHAYQLYMDLDDGAGMAETLTCLGAARRRAGDHRSAARELEKALGLLEVLGDPHGQADALVELGVARHLADDHEGALSAWRQARVLYRELGDLCGQATALTQLAFAEQLAGSYASALVACRQALAIYLELGDRYGRARVLNYLGWVLTQIGDYDAALATLTEGLTLHRELGYRAGEANAMFYLGTMHCRAGEPNAAQRPLARALDLYQELGDVTAQADTVNQTGVMCRLTGDPEAAIGHHERALDAYRGLANDLGQAEVHNCLGSHYLSLDRPAEALDHFRRAGRLAHRASSPREDACAIEGAGVCALRLGDPRAALTKLRKARAAYRRIGAAHAARVVDGLIADLGGDATRR
ncbi:MAG TPA: tetratricopeptide repeat protein [Micromonosporaceae bacterium]|nr:tetratricopeptide repeat protein [Micromonosporaceae bacterium]